MALSCSGRGGGGEGTGEPAGTGGAAAGGAAGLGGAAGSVGRGGAGGAAGRGGSGGAAGAPPVATGLFGALLYKTQIDVDNKVTTAVNRFFGIGTGEPATPTADSGYRCYYELPQDSS